MSIYGIDFGYSKACIATLDSNGRPIVISNLADASDELATAVYFENADNVIVGSFAKDMIETEGDRVVQFIKKDIGKSRDRVYEFDGKSFNSIEICALILKRLKQIVVEQGKNINDVVVAMPSYFGLEEKAAVKSAVELAGLNLIGTITEPVAAALSYLLGEGIERKNILVYDLGGGSIDISILQVSRETKNNSGIPSLKILSADGSDNMGGEAWESRLYDFILQMYCNENGISIDEVDAETRQVIRMRANNGMRKLCSTEKIRVRIAVDGVITTVTVSREDFESITLDLCETTMTYVDQSLQKANNINIDTVLLVGGATRMPVIHRLMENRFPGKVQSFEPEHAVAMGAAIYGYLLNNICMPEQTYERKQDKTMGEATKEILELDELFEKDKQHPVNECDAERDCGKYNYYELLQLDFDPPEQNRRRIDKAIVEWKKRTGVMLANETIAIRRADLSDQLSLYDDVVECMGDLKRRNIEARELRNKRIKELLRLISSLPSHNHSKRMITWDEIVDLSEQFKLRISTVCAVLEKEAIAFEKEPCLVNLNDTFISIVNDANIRQKLDDLKRCSNNLKYQRVKNIYDFLNCYFGVDDIQYDSQSKETTELECLTHRESVKLSSNMSLEGHVFTDLFCSACQQVFSNEKNRQRYDNSLKISQLNDMFSIIDSAPMSFKKNPHYADRWIIEIMKLIPDEKIAIALYNRKAKTGKKPYIPSWYVSNES